MTDKKTLDLARQWAEHVQYGKALDDVQAAADLISSLPDEWVDAEKLREVVADHHIDMSEELMEALGALLPAPRTMDEIEWDDTEHRFAGAETENGYELVMLERRWVEGRPDLYVILCVDPEGKVETWLPGLITPTGRKYRLEPEDDVAYATGGALTTQDVVDECRAVRKERAAAESTSPCPERVPEFDPAYTYRDRDGETWEYLDGKWVQGDSRTDRLVSLNVNHGLNNLLPKFGPYTRIEE